MPPTDDGPVPEDAPDNGGAGGRGAMGSICGRAGPGCCCGSRPVAVSPPERLDVASVRVEPVCEGGRPGGAWGCDGGLCGCTLI